MHELGEKRIGPPANPNEPDDRFGLKPLSRLPPTKCAEEKVNQTTASVEKVIKKTRN